MNAVTGQNPTWPMSMVVLLVTAMLMACYYWISKFLMNATVHDARPFHPLWLATLRQVSTLLVTAPYVAASGSPYLAFPARDWFFIMLRTVLGFLAVVVGQMAVKYISLTDFSTIQAVSPVVTSLVAWPMLGEAVRTTDVPAILACVAGVLYIVEGDFSSGPQHTVDLIGHCFALCLVACQAGLFVVFRKLRHVPFSSATFIYGLVTSPVMIVLSVSLGYARWPPCDPANRTFSFLVGISAAIATLLQILAARRLKAKIMSLQMPAELFWLFLFQVLPSETSTAPTRRSLIGASLVMGAFVYLFLRSLIVSRYRRYQEAQRRDSPLLEKPKASQLDKAVH